MSQISDFAKIENLEGLMFSFLTRQKTVIVGSKQLSENFFNQMVSTLPTDLRKHLTSGLNDNSLSKDFVVSFLEVNEDSMKFLDKSQGKYTIVFLPSNQVFGQYTSPLCKKFISHLKANRIEVLKKEIEQLYEEAINSEEIITPADYAAKNNKNKADASLILWMRALHYKKEIDNSIINNEVW